MTMASLSSHNQVDKTTQQQVTNDDVIPVDGDTFLIITTHFDVSKLNQTTDEEDRCGMLFAFNGKFENFSKNVACLDCARSDNMRSLWRAFRHY